jgi:hypothetical protein
MGTRQEPSRAVDREASAGAVRGTRARPVGVMVLSALFLLAAAANLVQVVMTAAGLSQEPLAILIGHTVMVVLAITAAVGVWRMARWAPWACTAWGAFTAAFVLSLGPVLSLDAPARAGLRSGAAAIVACGLATAWYARRSAIRSGSRV